MLPANSVLFSSRAPIGYVAIAKNELCTNQGFKSIIPNDSCNFLFLFYLLKFNKELIESKANGSTFKEVSGKTMNGITVHVPPLPIQQKIASVLSAIDDKIELNQRMNENLEAQAQSLYKSWFVEFEPWGGIMPSDWDYSRIGKICKCELGGTPSRTKKEYWNGDIPWINSGEVNKFRIIQASEFITELGMRNSSTKLLPKHTTVVAITGATLGQYSLLEIESCANQSVVGIIPNYDIPYPYIYLHIANNMFDLIKHATGGAQQHINKQNVEDMPVLLPPQTTLSDFNNEVSPCFEIITNNCNQNSRLAALRDTLLPRLMSGELGIENINI